MGLFDKISNLIFEEDSENTTPSKKKKTSLSDIFFEDDSIETTQTKKKKLSLSDIFYEDDSAKAAQPKKKKLSLSDIFFEEDSDAEIKSTFVEEEQKTSVLSDISSQIERRESELINLSEFFKSVNPADYPDSSAEFEAYLSLVKQLNAIKDLSTTSKNSTINSINNYQLEGKFRKFELDYKAHINAIQSLCYLSEISTINSDMQKLFSNNFTTQTEVKITQTEGYISLISKKSDKFDKKYSKRLYKELIEAEYRLTLLKLMAELKNEGNPRRNPFASFSPQKKETFQIYLSKDIRDTNTKYNTVADNREKYTKYDLVQDQLFDKIDADAEIISAKINKYTIDDFLLNELLDNGDGFETLKRFLKFKLDLNFIDSKTPEADKKVFDDHYDKITSNGSSSKKGNLSSFPDFDDDF